MKNKHLWLLLTAGSLGITLVLVGAKILQPYPFQGSVIEPPIPAPDFTLEDQSGQPFTLSKQRGKVVVLFFGYTSCPDVCPSTLKDFQTITSYLDDRFSDVRFLMVTTDPERDTRERLGNYLSAFNPSFIGLRGPREKLEPVYSGFGVAAERSESEESAGYVVAHTSRIYAIDPAGNLRLTFPPGMGAEAMAKDILHLANQAQ